MKWVTSFQTRIGVVLAFLFSILRADPGVACDRVTEAETTKDQYAAERARMVEEQIAAREIKDTRVLAAMRAIPRHLFVPADKARDAYDDRPLPIGLEQTISQPYIVALMTELVRPTATDRVLEIGTGSGYQAAVLAQLVAHVYTIEIFPALAQQAKARFDQLGCRNVTVMSGDGYGGWPQHAPFDVIVVTAAPDRVPEPLLQQLKPGGRLVVPVGSSFGVQQLQLIEKEMSGKTRTTTVAPVRFVPLLRDRTDTHPEGSAEK